MSLINFCRAPYLGLVNIFPKQIALCSRCEMAKGGPSGRFADTLDGRIWRVHMLHTACSQKIGRGGRLCRMGPPKVAPFAPWTAFSCTPPRPGLKEIAWLTPFWWQDHGTFEVLLPRRTHSQSRAKQVRPPEELSPEEWLAGCCVSSPGAPGWCGSGWLGVVPPRSARLAGAHLQRVIGALLVDASEREILLAVRGSRFCWALCRWWYWGSARWRRSSSTHLGTRVLT